MCQEINDTSQINNEVVKCSIDKWKVKVSVSLNFISWYLVSIRQPHKWSNSISQTPTGHVSKSSLAFLGGYTNYIQRIQGIERATLGWLNSYGNQTLMWTERWCSVFICAFLFFRLVWNEELRWVWVQFWRSGLGMDSHLTRIST